MDRQQQRIAEDLSSLIAGDVRCDPVALSIYASDASLYQIPPLCVAYPRERDDLIAIAKYANEMNLPLIPRGAGTGLVGDAIGSGIVIDCSRYLTGFELIDDNLVRVQPGVVHAELNRYLKPRGLYFPPDPSNTEVTTIGSMLAIDAAGSRAIRVGSTRDYINTLEVILADGTCFDVGNESLSILNQPLPTGSSTSILGDQPPEARGEQVKRTILSRLSQLLADNESLIQEKQNTRIPNCSGYYLKGIKSRQHLNLARLLIGSEGTLALFSSAVLHVSPLPAHRGVALLLFGDLASAIKAVQTIIHEQPSACDLLDRRLLSLARDADPRFASLISPAAEAALLVEQVGFSDSQVQDRLHNVILAVKNINSRVVVAMETHQSDEVDFLWSLPQKVVPSLSRLPGESRPQPFVEDIAIPPECLYEFSQKAQKVFQRHHVTATLYAHAASGQIHLRPFLPTLTDQNAPVLESIARDLYQTVFSVNGTISGEHGDGLARTAFIRSQYGDLYRVFRQVKDIFDPHNLLNPGKIINDDPHVTIRHLRPVPEKFPELIDLQLNWTPQELQTEAARCNGCGSCRRQDSGSRMCPVFRVEPLEEASPRAKANLFRGLLSGAIHPNELSSEETKKLADTCFNCKQCQLDCPSSVNIPQMAIEAKAAYVSAKGLDHTDWILSRAHSFGAFGSTLSMAANWAINNTTARWVMEKLMGIHRNRKLPLFSRRSFLRSVPKRLTKRPRPGSDPELVVFFVDYYANYHDPELAHALLAVLQHNQIPVYVPPNQLASGMAMVSAGDLIAARSLAEENIRILSEFAREGHQIICSEPATAICLKQEYPMLVRGDESEAISSQAIEAGAFLLQLHESGRLKKDFQPLDLELDYHTPCHTKALSSRSPLIDLLALIPELQVNTIEKGCSGMAGAYGLAKDTFEKSKQIGRELIDHMKTTKVRAGATECSSCKMQMEQETRIPTIHPVKLLALSYGLMPEIERKLQPQKKKLVVS